MATRTSENPISDSQEASHDRVLLASRVLAVLIVPILVAAFIILYFFPNDTGRLFAWPIKPTMTAMMLGATYLGGAYFFSRAALARGWHTVSLGFIPVTTFAGILGIATLLHWDKFTHGAFAFELWALLYFTLPFIIPAMWYLNQRANRGSQKAAEQPFNRGLRLATIGLGAVLAIAGGILLLFPQVMIPTWPWTLTPLTGRVMAAMFALPGVVAMSVTIDGRWSSANIIFQAQGIAILFILIAVVRARDQIQWGSWSIWTFLGGMLLMLLLIGWAALEHAARSRAPRS
jgi:hypothetical protein